ncbi:hypothetical protein G4B88_029201, partial [Cannabis sativa]
SFGQHGRELITSELALRILSVLSGEHILQNMDSDFLNSTVNKLIIKVVPMENMNGRRGVDLNRNWSVDWGKKEEDFDPYEENPGSAPFSEPETQIMRKLALSFDPHIWVNVHSGMEALFMPYDHKNKTPDGVSSEQMKLMLEKVNLLHFHQHCMIGSGGGSVGYLAHGTATDFMYDIVKVPMAFTFEIYGDKAASTKDCFKMFNPTNFGTYNQVMSDWSAAFFTIFNLGTQQLAELPHKASASELVKWVSIDEYLDGYLMERTSRYGKKKEVFELGMQEIRTYFRLFLLSSILLMIMFYTRISKRKCSRPIVSTIRLTSHIVFFTKFSSFNLPLLYYTIYQFQSFLLYNFNFTIFLPSEFCIILNLSLYGNFSIEFYIRKFPCPYLFIYFLFILFSNRIKIFNLKISITQKFFKIYLTIFSFQNFLLSSKKFKNI